jgi:hypothetical protein
MYYKGKISADVRLHYHIKGDTRRINLKIPISGRRKRN